MKRRDFIIGCSMIFVLGMTGCESNKEAETTEPVKATEEVVEEVSEIATEVPTEMVTETVDSTEVVVWGYSKEEYINTWEYENQTEYLVIKEDDTWQLLNANQNVTQEGTWELAEGGIILSDADGKTYDTFIFASEDTLEAGNGELLDLTSMDTLVDVSQDNTAIVGKWKYEDYDVYLEIHDDLTCEMMDEEGEPFNGTEKITIDGTNVVLSLEDGSEDTTLSLDKDGNLLDEGGDILKPVESFPWDKN